MKNQSFPFKLLFVATLAAAGCAYYRFNPFSAAVNAAYQAGKKDGAIAEPEKIEKVTSLVFKDKVIVKDKIYYTIDIGGYSAARVIPKKIYDLLGGDISAIGCMAKNAYHEARGQGDVEQAAINLTVINRLNKGFANTICEVTTQKSKGVCQFSWVCNPKVAGRIDEKEQFERALDIALATLDGKYNHVNVGQLFFCKPNAVNKGCSWHENNTTKLGDLCVQANEYAPSFCVRRSDHYFYI